MIDADADALLLTVTLVTVMLLQFICFYFLMFIVLSNWILWDHLILIWLYIEWWQMWLSMYSECAVCVLKMCSASTPHWCRVISLLLLLHISTKRYLLCHLDINTLKTKRIPLAIGHQTDALSSLLSSSHSLMYSWQQQRSGEVTQPI